jgi:sugar lactone lactonase YvrE
MFGAARVPTLYMGGGGAGGSAPAGYSWDISTATSSYTGTARVGEQDATISDIYFKDDGTKMYGVGTGNDRVYEYTLSTAWNIFSATSSTFISIGTQETTANGLAFSSDGTKMYIVGQANDTVYQYTLSTAWLVSSATYASKSFSVSGQSEGTPTGLDFSTDGTKMYVIGSGLDTVFQYTLSTAWDVSTASYASKSFSVTTQASSPQSVRFADSGTKFYIVNSADSTAYQYTCSTAWDVSTASYATKSYQFSGIGSFDSNLTGLYVKSDGTKVFCVGTSVDFVWNFNLSTAYDITTSSFASTDQFRIGAQEGNAQSIFFKPDGTRCFMFGDAQDRVFQYNLSTAWDINTMTYASVQSPTLTQDTNGREVVFSSDGTKFYLLGQTGTSDTIYQYTMSTAWNPSTATYASKSLVVGTQDATPQGMAFNDDGTKMYMVGDSSDTVYQYTLSTAWDISTGSYASISKSVATEDAVPNGITFKTDGTKMYIIGSGNDRIFQYTLSTAWNVSTATYDSKSVSVLNIDNLATGLAIAADGSKLYVVGSNIDRIVQWSLT